MSNILTNKKTSSYLMRFFLIISDSAKHYDNCIPKLSSTTTSNKNSTSKMMMTYATHPVKNFLIVSKISMLVSFCYLFIVQIYKQNIKCQIF